ncbi:MAG: 3-deoxy-7-phosphoheptulonate synthase, partial [Planctomycetota bacterium]
MTQSDWREFPALQQPTYPNQEQLQAAVRRLRALPPLVTSWEIEALKTQLAEAASGKRLLLQGGDCAESFDECSSDAIAGKLKVLLQMSLVMVHGTRRPVVRVGRFAGQYAKPRSKDTETKDGVELPCYRGDNVNGPAFTAEDRTPNPWRLVKGHERAALTLNFIRSLIDGGFADLHHPEYWNLGFVADSPNADRYRQIVEEIQDSISFMETIAGRHLGQTDRVDFFTSHEGLHLEAEAALTREVPRR